MEENIKKIKSMIRDVADFPKKGILFRDITTALKDAETLKIMVDELYEIFKDEKIDYVAGIESRGFIFGMPLAYKLNCGFIPVRKPKKLPCETISQEYSLEYGTDKIEIHKDAIKPGQKVVLIDDLIATGGTMKAAAQLVEELGGEVVKLLFLIELAGLEGRKALEGYDVDAVVTYDGK